MRNGTETKQTSANADAEERAEGEPLAVAPSSYGDQKCSACGHQGALTFAPSWGGAQIGFLPFPGDESLGQQDVG